MNQHPNLRTDDYHAHDERIVDEKILDRYACPCNSCRGGKRKIRMIYEHMLKFSNSGVSPFKCSLHMPLCS